jgi:hypothetical protein
MLCSWLFSEQLAFNLGFHCECRTGMKIQVFGKYNEQLHVNKSSEECVAHFHDALMTVSVTSLAGFYQRFGEILCRHFQGRNSA